MRIRNNKGFTLIELLIVIAIIGIIAAIAIPGLMRARMSTNETSAIGSLRSINSANATYAASCGNNGYAQQLQDLALAPANNPPFISPDLNANGVVKSGYLVNLGPGEVVTIMRAAADTCNKSGKDAIASYFAEAHAAQQGRTGFRTFGTDERGTIFFDMNPAGPVPFTSASVAAAPQTAALQ